jgi:single-stranded-DNA-specific exonuclease
MHSRWLINKTNPEYVKYLSAAASVSPVFAQVLINRGLKTPQSVSDFLHPSISDLSDPFELPSMKQAVERLKYALHAGQKVLIHGDYDTDGLTATAIMVQVLRGAGLEVDYFIPNRSLHGYGFHLTAVDLARKIGAKLILTVDCGITAFEAASYAAACGIDVIITDHHEPLLEQSSEFRVQSSKSGEKENLPSAPFVFRVPDAIAVVNPKLGADPKLSDLSGAGIALKYAQAFAREEAVRLSEDDVLPLFDLAALGTLADVVPLTGENRIILREGLKLINSGARPGIRALKEVSGLAGGEMRAGRLAFTLVPRINAAGRMADARDVVQLLLSTDDGEAQRLSFWLDSLNRERQQTEAEVYQMAIEKLGKAGVAPAIVLAGEGWHQGVLGIVASKIAGEFCRPAFILSVENGIAKGSARSIPAFDICRGLAEAGDCLLSFGGHAQAAGMILKAEDLPAFEQAMKGIVQHRLDASAFQPVLEIDANVCLTEVTHGLVREFGMLEPFGCGNPEPLIGSKALEIVSPRTVGGKHLKLKLRKGALALDAIGFDMGGLMEGLRESGVVDVLYTPSINDWNGGRYLQLVLKALRPGQ